MSDPGAPSEPTSTDRSSRLVSPGAARRRLGSELKVLREAAGLTLSEAGTALERSAATISRFESAKTIPRIIDVSALIEFYVGRNPRMITPEVRERILRLVGDARKEQWFDKFKDITTGDMTPDHYSRLLEYETDATEMRSYESDLVPGLLQTRSYARTLAEVFFPGRLEAEHERFVDFRMQRQRVVADGTGSARYFVVISEVALRRDLGRPDVHAEQLRSLLADLNGARSAVDVRIIPLSAAIPAALGGPFIVFSFEPGDYSDGDLIYLESRSGGDYLSAESDIERFNGYFESLIDNALPKNDAIRMIENLVPAPVVAGPAPRPKEPTGGAEE